MYLNDIMMYYDAPPPCHYLCFMHLRSSREKLSTRGGDQKEPDLNILFWTREFTHKCEHSTEHMRAEGKREM